MFVPLLLNQGIVLNGDGVPHVIFLKIITALSRFSENTLVIIRLALSDIERINLPVVCKPFLLADIYYPVSEGSYDT